MSAASSTILFRGSCPVLRLGCAPDTERFDETLNNKMKGCHYLEHGRSCVISERRMRGRSTKGFGMVGVGKKGDSEGVEPNAR